MKNNIWIYLVIILVIIFVVIGILYVKNNKNLENNKIKYEVSKSENNEVKNEIVNDSNNEDNSSNKKSLVLYFSATNNTEHIANLIKDVTNSDIIEIKPKQEYTSNDLNYNNNNSRANREQNDDFARPEIANTNLELDNYEVIYLGYPIWWGKEPRIILTLLDTYNFEGKIIIPFCTSGGSGIETSVNNLRKYNSKLNVFDGRRFSVSSSKADVENWLKSLNLVNKEESETISDMKIKLKIDNKELTATLENNSSSREFLKKLENNKIIIDMKDYSNMEKVGNLGFSLPTNDKNYTTKAGDIILYQGNQITIYYDTNTWSFTKLGEIDNITQNELKDLLGTGNVQVEIYK